MSSDRTPFFSVITPTFNRARTLPRAIVSILAQTTDDWEYIIIDDGSTDNTNDLLQALPKDSRIQYKRSVNQGTSKARDLGCSMASGRYLTFLDSDDEYLPHHLESRLSILSANPAIELLHGGVEIIGDPYVADKFDTSKTIHLSECVIGGTFFIRRDLWKRVGGFGSVAYGDDTDFFAKATEAGALITTTNQPTYKYYRTEADSLCKIVEAEGLEGINRYRNSTTNA